MTFLCHNKHDNYYKSLDSEYDSKFSSEHKTPQLKINELREIWLKLKYVEYF